MNFIIYTDGACEGNQFNRNIGGWAAIIFEEGSQNEINTISNCKKNTTNNQMELTACIESLKILNRQKLNSKDKITIYTDSAYISNCFNQKWYEKWEKNNWKTSNRKDVKNKELWQILLNLFFKFPKITIKHVKGHSGDKYNELVDQLAVKAIQKCK